MIRQAQLATSATKRTLSHSPGSGLRGHWCLLLEASVIQLQLPEGLLHRIEPLHKHPTAILRL